MNRPFALRFATSVIVALGLLVAAPAAVAVLHQDSNHSEAISCAEVEQWTPKLARDGYWIADDTDWATTQRAQRRLHELGFEVVEDHVQWKVLRRR